MTEQRKILRKAVFLDRDGTINVEKDYLYRIEDFEFIEGVPQALKCLQDAGYLLVVVTNQSGIARGLYNLEDVEKLHGYMQDELLKYGVSFGGIYVCPHHPQKGLPPFNVDCECRKGKPGMLLQAAKELNIDLSTSFMVGDKLSDFEAGERAGCRSFLVETGHSLPASDELNSLSDLKRVVTEILDSDCTITA